MMVRMWKDELQCLPGRVFDGVEVDVGEPLTYNARRIV